MSVITSGKTFANGEQLTADKLNQVITAATFNAAEAVDNATTGIDGSGAIVVRDGGITADKINTASVFGAIYPIGSIYINATNSDNPSTLLGFGTWVAFGAGRVPLGIDSGDADFDTAEETGGAKTHTLTTSEIPSHVHGSNMLSINSNEGRTTFTNRYLENYAERSTYEGNTDPTGGGDAHNNLPPYIVVHMWKRTA